MRITKNPGRIPTAEGGIATDPVTGALIITRLQLVVVAVCHEKPVFRPEADAGWGVEALGRD